MFTVTGLSWQCTQMFLMHGTFYTGDKTLISASDSFLRFLALYKFVCMYVIRYFQSFSNIEKRN